MHSNILNLFRPDSDSIALWSNRKSKDELLLASFSVNTVKITLKMYIYIHAEDVQYFLYGHY